LQRVNIIDAMMVIGKRFALALKKVYLLDTIIKKNGYRTVLI